MAGTTTSDDTIRPHLAVRVSPTLLAQLNAFISSHRYKPTRTMIVETAIREFLEREGAIEPVVTASSVEKSSVTSNAASK